MYVCMYECIIRMYVYVCVYAFVGATLLYGMYVCSNFMVWYVRTYVCMRFMRSMRGGLILRNCMYVCVCIYLCLYVCMYYYLDSYAWLH